MKLTRINKMSLACVKFTERAIRGMSESKGYWINELETEDNPDVKGLAFLTHPQIKDFVADFKSYSEELK